MKPASIILPWLIPLAVLVLYASVVRFDFVNYDDPLYLQLNPGVMEGFSFEGLKTMWGQFSYGNWHPITLMSHALDVRLFGLHPGGHHAVSVLIHCLNSLLLFHFLARWTGRRDVAFWTALLWAIHPLQVDAVAWVSQRKTLLSAFFGLLVLIQYGAYRQAPTLRRGLTITGLFLLSLASKGALVTLPLVCGLVLPLLPCSVPGRAYFLRHLRLAALLLVPGIAFGVLVMIGQGTAGSIVDAQAFPLMARAGHALANLLHYPFTVLLPFGLAIHYPPPSAPLSLGAYLAAGALVAGITGLAWCYRNRWPHLLAGWGWYLILIAPLSGILATGQAIKTDRFAYMPSIGLFLIIGWILAAGVRHTALTRYAVLLLPVLLAGRTYDQIQVWRNNETVYRHALAVTDDNALVRNNLAVHYIADNRMDLAAVELVEALRLLSDDPFSWHNLELVLASSDGQRALRFHLDEIAALHPDDPYYRLVRFMIALVQVRQQDAQALWETLMADPASTEAIRSKAREFRGYYEELHGPLF